LVLTDDEKLRLYKTGMENETTLHWTRNNYFLLTSSILLVVLGLFSDEIMHGFLGVLGLTLNIVWLLIQHRSSKYIGYWKKQISSLSESSFSIYPTGITKIEMRKLAYILPLPFIMVWAVVLFIAIHPDLSIANHLPVIENMTGI
jgi:hypothetical protein